MLFRSMDKVRAAFRDDAKVKSSKKLRVMEYDNDLKVGEDKIATA